MRPRGTTRAQARLNATAEPPCIIRDYEPRRGVRLWLGFPLDTDRDQARRHFRERYGYSPSALVPRPRLLFVGPVLGGGAGWRCEKEVGQ
jgi:hypothetical protein